VIERGQFQLLHDFKANVVSVRPCAYGLGHDRDTAILSLNQMDREQRLL
jgi:hypothetical protein